MLARLLTPQDFGIVTAALTVIAMLDAALDLGVGAAIIASPADEVAGRVRAAFTLNLGLSVGISAIGVAASPLLAALFHASGHVGVFALVFVYPLLRGAGQVSDSILRRNLQFRRRTVVDLARAAVRVLVSVPLALTVGGPVSIAGGIVASEFVAFVVLTVLVPIRPDLRPSAEVVRTLLRFGGQLTIVRILGSFRSSFDYVVVGAALGATALGFYGMAYKLPELLIENVLWIFSAVALATYAQARAESDKALHNAMLRATGLLTLYGLAVGTALAAVARDAVPVLFSPQWNSAVVPMMLIAISLGLMSMGWASGDVFSAMGRPGTLLALDIPATVVMAGAFLLAPRWGLIGVAMVHLMFNAVYCVARLLLVRRVVGIGLGVLLRTVGPGVGVAALTAAAGFGTAALVPPGRLSSLVIVALASGAAIAGGSLLFARSSVRRVVQLALPGAR